MSKIFGFGILRNGVKYDYSFKESLTSLAGVAQETYLALGDSEDTTEQEIKNMNMPIKIIPTVWDPEIMRQKGIILSVQTNIALDKLREDHGDEDAWGFYLQCDEILHEDDYELIKKDIQYAQDNGYDAIRFRYLHFWKTHYDIAINKKWYPQEIRCVKLKTNIESWGDAQGFRHFTKVYQSEARIFHYGHVRQPEKYAVKKKEFLELYHDDKKIKKYRKREQRYDRMTKCLYYFGTHPKVMQERIENLGDPFELDWIDDVWIIGDKTKYSDHLINSIKAKNVHWAKSTRELHNVSSDKIIIVDPSWFQKVIYKTKVPKKMESKLAIDWNDDFYLTLKLSEKKVGLRHL